MMTREEFSKLAKDRNDRMVQDATQELRARLRKETAQQGKQDAQCAAISMKA